MKPSEYMDLINEIEERFPVDEWIIGDIHVWPLIRIQFATKLHCLGENMSLQPSITPSLSSRIQTGKKKLKGLSSYGSAYIKDRAHNDTLKENTDVVILSNTLYRSFSSNGAWYDIHCDPFIQKLKKQGIAVKVLENTPGQRYLIPRFSNSIYIQPYLAINNLLSLFYYLNPFTLNSFLPGFENFLLFIENKNFKFSWLNTTFFSKQINLLEKHVSFFVRILKRLKPRLGMVVCYYSLEGMAWCLACHKMKIPCFDIQHGVAGELHRAYGRWSCLPEKNYEMLPTGFWCWSEEDAEATRRSFPPGNNSFKHVIVGGNLWADLWKENKSPMTQSFNQEVSQLKKTAEKNVHILLSMQSSEISSLQLQAIHNSPSTFTWWIRAHPSRLHEIENIKNIFGETGLQVEIEKPSTLPLFALLQHVDVHLTDWSTVVYDAKYFGVPSVLTHQTGEELFQKEIKQNWCKTAYTPDEIITAICLQAEKKENLQKEMSNSSIENGFNELLQVCSPK